MRFGIVGVQRDGLLEPANADVASPELHERLACEKEVARLVGIPLRRFGGQIEGALVVSELDQQIGEIRVDHVVAGVVLVDERESLQVVLLRLGDVAERFGRQAEVVPRLVGPRVELGRAAKRRRRLRVPA